MEKANIKDKQKRFQDTVEIIKRLLPHLELEEIGELAFAVWVEQQERLGIKEETSK